MKGDWLVQNVLKEWECIANTVVKSAMLVCDRLARSRDNETK